MKGFERVLVVSGVMNLGLAENLKNMGEFLFRLGFMCGIKGNLRQLQTLVVSRLPWIPGLRIL
jgi:hypothetical protein